MSKSDLLQIFLSLAPLLILCPLLGYEMARVFTGKPLLSFLKPVERFTYRFCGVNETQDMNAKQYLAAVLMLNLLGFLLLFCMLFFQHLLPLNPQNAPRMTFDLAINTAMSFMTNTNWQSYSGETQASTLSQMAGFTVQNFLSAATAFGVLLALIRGLIKKESETLGNFWVDVTRSILYILLPLCLVFAIILISQGVLQNFLHPITATTLEGANQLLPMGPVASQEAIKQLGTNGGGFFGANSAHPFENPTPFSNWLELVAILFIPAALPFTFGYLTNEKKQGIAIFTAMFILLVLMLGISLYAEPHGLMEGKEVRIGNVPSVIWSVFTTAASNGSVNMMHSSLSPIAGGIAVLNILLGEVIFGGVGSGLYGMLLFAILTVFLAGLMVGRTPEYLGKKIEAYEIKYTIIAILVPSVCVLIGSAIAFLIPSAVASLSTTGPHALTEMLYGFASTSNNNGSAFAGLNSNTPFYNYAFTLCMMIGRFSVIIPAVMIAGSLSRKKISPPSIGTFTTDNGIFIALLVSVVLIVGALTFFPVLTLGPILESFL